LHSSGYANVLHASSFQPVQSTRGGFTNTECTSSIAANYLLTVLTPLDWRASANFAGVARMGFTVNTNQFS